jgi:hypothetical protein
MSIATYSALAGMRSAALRLEVSARKVASVGATRTGSASRVDGGPVYLLTPVDQAGLAGQVPAVSGVSTRNGAPAWMASYQDAAGNPDTAPAEANLAAEALEQATARASFIANAKTLQITQAMVKQLFELKS